MGKTHTFDVRITMYESGITFSLIRTVYGPNGRVCNAELERQQMADPSASPYELAAALYDFCFDCAVLTSLRRAL
jgi:hypothetical protein